MQFLKQIGFMHQSFVTTAPMGPGHSGDIDFSLCKAWALPSTAATFTSPTQIPAGKSEITMASLGMESKAPRLHGTAMLRSKHVTLAPLCPRYPLPHRGRAYK